MPVRSRYVLLAAAALTVGCQTNTTTVGTPLPPPQNLTYQVEASGDPKQPAGILLSWNDVQSSSLASYNVYSRGSTTGSYGLRGVTSSNTFHDNGVPHLQYFVTAVDVNGLESAGSNVVTVNEYLQIGAPSSLVGISLDSAIHLDWQDTPDFGRFKWYRVYSSGYNAALTSPCFNWALEGTTVSHEFLAAQLPNGVTRCFDVSAVDTLGYESLWAPFWSDTPRPDARNVLVWAYGVNTPQSGFRFWNDANGNGYGDPGELGLVQDGNRTDIDFWVHVASDSTLWFVPEFTGDSMQLYSTSPIADLTAIDFAPASGYTRNMYQAVPGYGYVFKRTENGQVHYAGLRVTAVSHQYVIFDWSVQTAAGNRELVPPLGPTLTGKQVAVSR